MVVTKYFMLDDGLLNYFSEEPLSTMNNFSKLGDEYYQLQKPNLIDLKGLLKLVTPTRIAVNNDATILILVLVYFNSLI